MRTAACSSHEDVASDVQIEDCERRGYFPGRADDIDVQLGSVINKLTRKMNIQDFFLAIGERNKEAVVGRQIHFVRHRDSRSPCVLGFCSLWHIAFLLVCCFVCLGQESF